MPKKSKIGKQRKDKFYKLAKETGFRSRASFKLIQLNRKFEFLPKSRVLIDLCAAPGGWLQVAQQAMPVSSIIIGIDLVPIKPLPNVVTFKEDITTDRCRQALKKQLSTWKADVVLHDGAPNVGKNWIQDAFSQNELTLSALKLAAEFLSKGGWFITKVFRSKDYFNLVWVFKKLFKYVHVTKPQASRNESAEIFIVCQGYLAPDRIDPKFLDANHLFKDVINKNDSKSNILAPTTKKPKAEGYDDDSSVYSSLKASDFIFCENHLERLGKCTQIVFDDDDIRDHKLTTDEIKECCKDVKVLGKADLKLLLNWQKQMKNAVKGAEKAEERRERIIIDKDQIEDREIERAFKEAEELELSKLQEAKKKKKKVLKERRKLHDRLNLKMIIKDDEPIIEEDLELFKLSQIKNKKELSQVEDEDNLEFNMEPPSADVENILEYRKLYVPYNRHDVDDHRVEANPVEKEDSVYSSDEDQVSELEFESGSEQGSDDDEVAETILEGKRNPLMVDLVDRPDRVNDTVERWFDKEDFTNNSKGERDLELDILAETIEKKKLKAAKSNEDMPEKEGEIQGVKLKGILKSENDKKEPNSAKKKDKRKRVKLDVEGYALGSLLVQSKKMKRDIIENAYNRYASNDENLPAWFVEDEKIHYRKQIPVTAEMVREYRERIREINARPIKKVIEARARRKRKAAYRMEKAKKKAEKVTEHPDMGEKEKAEQLKSIYKKALPKEDHNVTYIVAKKGVGRRVRRPPNIKGRFKVVDPRMKKDAMKEKTAFKAQKKSGKKNTKQKQRKSKKKR